jgi:soluble lytic murein transglycosylase
LRDYPLHPYLELARLRRDLASARADQINAFLERYGDQLPGARLREAWLKVLDAKGRWPEYLDTYREDGASIETRCTRIHALWQTGSTAVASTESASIWQSPRSLPGTCDRALAPWLARGNPTPTAAWERLELAMTAGQVELARYLQRFLDEPLGADARLFLEIHERPARLSDAGRFRADNARHAQIAAYGITRLARTDAAAAREGFERLARAGILDPAGQRLAAPAVAAGLALGSPGEALHWVLGLRPGVVEEKLADDALRYALRAGDWDGVSAAGGLAAGAESAAQRWAYWGARAAEVRGRESKEDLHQRFAKVRMTRSYYGFLAAERIGAPYEMQHETPEITPAVLQAAGRIPGIARAREFFVTGDILASRREFGYTSVRLDPQSRRAAARLADGWGWHTLAITSVAQAGDWNDLGLRFPVIYRDQFTAAARRQRLDPNWLFAIARQESALNPTARSPVGAMGLMQLMPTTAQQTARSSGLRYRGSADLLDPATNVQLGSHYMRNMLDDFGQNRILAAAAYNAGPGRVRQWLRRLAAPVDHDLFTETIPFRETRQYVQNVLSFAVIYAYLGGTQAPMIRPDERMIGIPERPHAESH